MMNIAFPGIRVREYRLTSTGSFVLTIFNVVARTRSDKLEQTAGTNSHGDWSHTIVSEFGRMHR
ncbi:hypothetical protein J21TS3_35990 [Paenibacillus cookii]|uniref:Uncharacterized protein n=1 Tax=Paenibacillus cookii TaxID=157839 RepID=A0ABQ4M0V4_9BACL|nr:hypothetical protein J21TS3_35990 [Paenibacillus cookii]